MILLARYGKLINTQLPVYAPPFPTPRHHNRGDNKDESWPGEAKLAAIRAAVEPALEACKPNFSLPDMPQISASAPLSKRQTIRFGESHKQELENAQKEEEVHGVVASDSHDSSLHQENQYISPNQLPMGGSLPPNLNLGPSPLPGRNSLGDSTSPSLPPRRVHAQDAPLSPTFEGLASHPASASVESGPTLAETGRPGPLTGTLSPRVKNPSTTAVPASDDSGRPSYFSDKDEEARRERMAQEQQEVANVTVGARLRRDGTIVRKGEADWNEELPPYHE
jgi:hypothetical protein